MIISIFDLFSIGVGPSSSHTVGPMRAANRFATALSAHPTFHAITVEVFGSLAFTGQGHGTDKAVLMGLCGELPESVDPTTIDARCQAIHDQKKINVGNKSISFIPNLHLILDRDTQFDVHTNAMRFRAYNIQSQLLLEEIYYSVGGGFIVKEGEQLHKLNEKSIPYPFESMQELVQLCQIHKLRIDQIMMANETTLRTEQEVKNRLLHIFEVMRACIQHGIATEGILPGGLNVRRRAHDLLKMFQKKGKPASYEHIDSINWMNMYAIAVNEENAAGGRVVTAPTNGAAGIIPAVLNYYVEFYPNATDDKIIQFLLTAGAITILFKKMASISGAEVGCQGEVGVASSMAAGALTAVLGGNIGQIENAAEIAIEHHLGLTCDPIAGLVQIPCIERNAMGAVKAINATQLALASDGNSHKISLDKAILTMKRTGQDMNRIYKETSLGGLAASYTEC